MVLDVTVTSDLSQVFIVVELRQFSRVTLEFLLTQELLYPFGGILNLFFIVGRLEKLRFSEEEGKHDTK